MGWFFGCVRDDYVNKYSVFVLYMYWIRYGWYRYICLGVFIFWCNKSGIELNWFLIELEIGWYM